MASAPTQDNKSAAKRVAVVGAGVSGLAAAYKLSLRGLNVTIFEAEERAGGKLRSVSQDGLIWDEGANTMTETEGDVSYLLDNLRLREKQQFPISQNKRYIVRDGTPVLLPSNPISLIKSNILSAQSKIQILLEPFLWKKNNDLKILETHESVGGFFQRHFGQEVVDYLIDPFVAGVNAGDPESLSMVHAFPDLWNLEKRFGSIIVGAVRSKISAKKGEGGGMNASSKSKRRVRGSFSFLGGMQVIEIKSRSSEMKSPFFGWCSDLDPSVRVRVVSCRHEYGWIFRRVRASQTLTDALCEEVGKDKLNLQTRVLELSCPCSQEHPLKNWSISYAPDFDKHLKEQSFDAVIMTAPLCDVKQMKITKRGKPFVLDFIPEVNYMPLSVVITSFKKENVKRPLEGFGVLVPSKEQQNGLKSLGTLFSSMMFPDRAPSDLYLYTTFIGGSRNQELAKASRDELKQIVTSDLRQLLGAEGEPTFINHMYWSKAFPLYGHDYNAAIEAIDKMEKNLPGFFYAGNHKGGLSVGKAISSGCKAADLVVSYLDTSLEQNLSEENCT